MNKRTATSVIASVTLLAAVVCRGAAETPPTATLSVVPDSTLPGLPVAFIVTIFNSDVANSMAIPNGMRLSVASASGSFDATGLTGQATVDFVPDQVDRCGTGSSSMPCLIVPAGGQRQLYVPAGPNLAENEFFADRRLSMPGVYDLEVSLTASVPGSGPIAIRTNTARLTVSQPVGTDAAVWQRMQQISGGRGWTIANWVADGSGLAAEVRTAYANSGYFAWVAAMAPANTTTAGLANIDAALARNPPASLRDDLLLTKGAFAAEASANALRVDRDESAALALADVARTAFTTLSNTALSLAYRKRAAEALTHLFTRRTADDELRLLAALDPPAPLPVMPRVECVSKGPGQSFSARFGYSNPNRGIKVLDLGPANQLTPAPRDVTQPRVFEPGNHSNVFTAASPGGELKWHLDGNVAAATADFALQCSQ